MNTDADSDSVSFARWWQGEKTVAGVGAVMILITNKSNKSNICTYIQFSIHYRYFPFSYIYIFFISNHPFR